MTQEQILEILDSYKLRIPPTVFYDLKADIVNYEEQEPTTKNCKSCRYYGLHHEVCNYCYECSLWTEGELTTKNDLGVDCISREQALVAIRNLYPDMPRVDFSGSLRKWVDKYKPYIECDDAIKQLPPVTPQEPKWIPVSERLPEERHGVLVLCPTRKNIYCACYEEKQWWIFGAYREKVTEEIVAWMPLPKAYREVEE